MAFVLSELWEEEPHPHSGWRCESNAKRNEVLGIIKNWSIIQNVLFGDGIDVMHQNCVHNLIAIHPKIVSSISDDDFVASFLPFGRPIEHLVNVSV